MLIDAGCDPNLEEGPNCPQGYALWAASRFGYFPLAKQLLEAGATPNASVESSGNPTESAINKEMRALMYRFGGKCGHTQYVFENNIDVIATLLRLAPGVFTPGVVADTFTMAVSESYETIVKLMLDAGFRVPSVLTGCQTYLWRDIELAELLLQHDMDPNLPNWQQIRPLHHMAKRNQLAEARLFMKYGAKPDAIDEEYNTTPLGWAAIFGQTEFAQMLLSAFPNRSLHEPDELPDWATPLAWAKRRNHQDIVELLS